MLTYSCIPFRRFAMLLFLLVAGLGAWQARAQFLDQGGLTGVVRDPSGAVIPGAKVTLTETETAFTQTSKTDKSGVYTFSPIKIGNYTVTATAPGFATVTQEHILITLGQRSSANLTLQAGSVTETVTVDAAPPLLQTQDSSTGQDFSSKQINDTPLNGRNIIYLAQLAPGVAPSKGSRANGNGDFDANGMRAEQNNFVLDGVDNNAVTQDYLSNTSYLINPPPDALAEFKISTSNYSAEYGHSAGAVVVASIKSGTNHIHGDVWEYFRNDYLDAHDWTLLPTQPNSEYRQNQFGATLGLPILKDHLFFFGDIQANRIVLNQPQNPITVPTAAERTGDFSELLYGPNTGLNVNQYQRLYVPQNNQAGVYLGCAARAGSVAYTPPAKFSDGTASIPGENALCPNQINPLAQKILNMYPLPNSTANGLDTQNYYYSLKQPQNTVQWDTRMDWNVTAKDQAFARFSYLNTIANDQAPLGPVLDGGGGQGSLNVSGEQVDYANNFLFSETHIFNQSLVNEFRFAFAFAHFDTKNPGFNINSAAALGFGGIPFGAGFPDNGGLPTTSISGGGGIASFGAHAYRPEEEFADEYQILDNLSYQLGKHSVKTGFSFQSIRSDTLEPPSSHPAYTFSGVQTSLPGTSQTGSGVADFLLDEMSGGSIGPSGTFNDAQNIVSGYVQDDWRITNKLTLNLGLRIESFQPYKEMAGRQANFVVNSTGISTGIGTYYLPARDQNTIALNPAFLALLNQDHITLAYDPNDRLTTAQTANFAPRVGFAYTVQPTTVVRGGFGMFYQGQQQSGSADNIATNYPFVFSDNFPAAACNTPKAGQPANCQTNGYTLESGFGQALAAGLTTYFATPGLVGESRVLNTTYALDYNVAVEQAFTSNFVFTLSYVGTGSRHLPIAINTNSTTVLLPSGTTQNYLPFPQFTGDADLLYEGISSYNALQTKLQKRITHGLDFSANYTWSHSLDDAANPLGGGLPGYRDASIVPIRQDYTESGYDTRHRFTFNGFYELPVGRGKHFLGHSNAVVDALLGGYSTNVTYQLQTGQPFTVSTANQTNVTGGSQYPILVGNPFAPGGQPNQTNKLITCPTSVRNKTHWYNPCAFANPLPASLLTPFASNNGNPTVAAAGYQYPSYITDEATALLFLGGRSNQLYGPGIQRLDMSAFKHFHTFEAQYLEIRADCFNVTNTPVYANPSTANIGQNGGLITGARQLQVYTPNSRFFQVSAKYVF